MQTVQLRAPERSLEGHSGMSGTLTRDSLLGTAPSPNGVAAPAMRDDK
ncbi:MAG: hypothetical protein AVDCRST_MAG43-2203, partial [uncultured Thermomicrobiales bacterium]